MKYVSFGRVADDISTCSEFYFELLLLKLTIPIAYLLKTWCTRYSAVLSALATHNRDLCKSK